MRYLATFALASAAVVAGRPASAAVNLSDPATRTAIVAAVEHDRAVYGGRTPVPGVLISVSDGRGGAFVRGFGYENLKTKAALTSADHFRIGSNTKVFVVTVLLQLVDEGKLSLDDPLSKFNLGVTVPNAKNITVREACEMRSGLFEVYDAPEFDRMHLEPSSILNPRTMLKWAVAQKPYFAPGKGYHYSNTNYLILGLLIESLTHDTIQHQIAKRILLPYGLHQTSFPTTMAMPAPWARGYGLDAHKNWEDVSNTIPVSLMWAAGAMISDMADMNRWVKIYVIGTTNSAKMQRERLNCVPIGTGNLAFGLGIGCSAGWYGYTGGLPGYNTATYYLPVEGITITAWVDLQRHDPFPGVANAIFGDIARIVAPDHVPFVKAAGTAGRGL